MPDFRLDIRAVVVFDPAAAAAAASLAVYTFLLFELDINITETGAKQKRNVSQYRMSKIFLYTCI